MPAPPVYLDECVDYSLIEALRKRGFAATAAADEGMIEADDEAQLDYATRRGWIIITHNGKHFRRLHITWLHQGRSHGGIIVLPERPPPERLVIRAVLMLDWIVSLPDYRSQLFRWGRLQELLEHGCRLPTYSEADIHLALGRTIP